MFSPRFLTCLGVFVFMMCLPIQVYAMDLSESASSSDEAEEVEHGKINTPDPSVVEPNHIEFETTYAYAHSRKTWDDHGDLQSRGLSFSHTAGFSLTAGVADDFDISLSSEYGWVKDKDNDYDPDDAIIGPGSGNGFGDLDVSARYRFYENKDLSLEVAYLGGLTIPTGSKADRDQIGTSQEYWGFNQKIVGVKDWDRWTVNADAGFSLPFGSRRDDARGTINADVAAGYQVLSWLQPEVELNYAHDFIAFHDDSSALSVTGGLVMPIHERLRVNVGVQHGLYGRNTDRTTTFVIAAKTAF